MINITADHARKVHDLKKHSRWPQFQQWLDEREHNGTFEDVLWMWELYLYGGKVEGELWAQARNQARHFDEHYFGDAG